jgi:hypothetical protein
MIAARQPLSSSSQQYQWVGSLTMSDDQNDIDITGKKDLL